MTELPAHSRAYRTRRVLNWFPLGLAYAFLYMGRYNLTVAKTYLGDLMTKEDFGVIFGVGTAVYGVAFLLNGPLTDKLGGRRAMLASVLGASLANAAMGLFLHSMVTSVDPGQVDLRGWMSLLYGANMYFQSFGAVAIVKVNSSWFHVRERGSFSGIFGTMISSGIFFAFTVNSWIMTLVRRPGGDLQPIWWVFVVPAALLFAIFAVELFLLRDRPSQAGFADFDTADADSGSTGEVPVPPVIERIPLLGRWMARIGRRYPVAAILMRIFTNPIILTIAGIEFCTGVLRQGIMHWFPIYASEVWVLPRDHGLVDGGWGDESMPVALILFALAALCIVLARRTAGRRRAGFVIAGALAALGPFLQAGWGGLLFVAGVVGGNVAGFVSDLFFQSRRAPAAGGLYGLMIVGAVAMIFALGGTTTEVGWVGADPKDAYPLRPGDRIVAVVGATEIRDWKDVSRAVACVPSRCVEPKRLAGVAPRPRWDREACKCSTRPKADGSDLPVSTGALSATVFRDGIAVALEVPDPRPAMTAGDTRKLPAGPRLPVSPWLLGALGFLMSLCVIGTHGLLSGTATMDFGGRKGAATAVGVIDGCVYLGTATQSFSLGRLTTMDWAYWPMFLAPFPVIGFVLCLTIWNKKPGGPGGGH